MYFVVYLFVFPGFKIKGFLKALQTSLQAVIKASEAE